MLGDISGRNHHRGKGLSQDDAGGGRGEERKHVCLVQGEDEEQQHPRLGRRSVRGNCAQTQDIRGICFGQEEEDGSERSA